MPQTSINLSRNFSNTITAVWAALTAGELLEQWFLPVGSAVALNSHFYVSFSDKPNAPKALWQANRMTQLAFIEFTVTYDEQFSKKPLPASKVIWRLTQDNGLITLNITDFSLTSSGPALLLEKHNRKKFWTQSLNKLEHYLEQTASSLSR